MADRGEIAQMIYDAGNRIADLSNLTKAISAEVKKYEEDAKALDAVRTQLADLTARRDALAGEVSTLEGRRSQAQAGLDALRAKIA